MYIERTFEVIVSVSEAEKRVKMFLTQIGYRQLNDAELRFKRGSLLGSLSSLNSPRRWKSHFSVIAQSLDKHHTKISLNLDVNTTGQTVTQIETEYWNTEFQYIQKAIQTGYLSVKELDNDYACLMKINKREFGKTLLLEVGIAIFVVVPISIFISFIDFTLSDIGIILAIAFGIGLFLKYRKPL